MPDARRIVCVDRDHVVLVDALNGAIVPVRTLPYPADNQFDVSPDGQWLYASMSENLAEIWIATPAAER